MKPQALLKMGIAYYNLNNADNAINTYKQLLNSYPNSIEAEDALANLRVIYVEQGRPSEYAQVARQAGKPISVNTEDSLTYAAAEVKLENGNTAEALNAFSAYLQQFSTGKYSTEAHYHMAEIYYGSKEFAKALASYQVIAERAPNEYAERAVLQAARINFFELKNYAEAERYYAQLKQITSSQEGQLEAMRG
jgi:TolA-binding protein